jgi:hypothetical protein
MLGASHHAVECPTGREGVLKCDREEPPIARTLASRAPLALRHVRGAIPEAHAILQCSSASTRGGLSRLAWAVALREG